MATTSAGVVTTRHMYTAPVGTAGNDTVTVVCEAPFTGTVTRVVFVPVSTITGAATNNRTHSVTNRTNSAAVVATLSYGNGTNATAYAEKAITLSGTAANLNVTSGDVLTFESTHVGTGITDPGGTVIVEFTRGEASA